MTLNANDRALIAACSQILAGNVPYERIDLHSLNEAMRTPAEIVVELAHATQQASDGKLTVRAADICLFNARIRGINLYLAVCNTDNDQTIIRTVTTDVQLLSFGPYSNGFTFPAKQATPETTMEAHIRQTISEEHRGHRVAGELMAEHLFKRIVAHMRRQVAACTNQAKAEAADEVLRRAGDLTHIGTACAILNLDLTHMVHAAITADI
jgi:hypothetical protein